jgi:hypothetical protein
MVKKKEIVVRSENFDCPVDGALFVKLLKRILAAQRSLAQCECAFTLAKCDLEDAERDLRLAALAYLTPNGRYDRRRVSDLKTFGLDLVEPSKSWNWDEVD